MNAIHPDLARVARWLPTIPTTERSIAVLRWLSRLAPPASARGVNRASRTIPGRDASRALEVHVYRPESARGRAPALLWMHGGGYVLGHPLQDGALAAQFARELGITVVAVRVVSARARVEHQRAQRARPKRGRVAAELAHEEVKSQRAPHGRKRDEGHSGLFIVVLHGEARDERFCHQGLQRFVG